MIDRFGMIDTAYTPANIAVGRYIGCGCFTKGAAGQSANQGLYFVSRPNRPAWLVEGRWYALRAEGGLYLVEDGYHDLPLFTEAL